MITAGQRVQVIKRDPATGRGVLQFGTEVVVGGRRLDRRPARRLPGRLDRRADHARRCSSAASRTSSTSWTPQLKAMIPSYGKALAAEPRLAKKTLAQTEKVLELA